MGKENMCNCSSSDKIDKVYIINANDCVFENDNVRIKRKVIVLKKITKGANSTPVSLEQPIKDTNFSANKKIF